MNHATVFSALPERKAGAGVNMAFLKINGELFNNL